ncbi:MAG: carbon-nitrogen hydrolase family protein, partial [bacterium]
LEDLNLHAKHGLFALTGSLNAGIFKYWKQPDGSVIGEALFNGQKDDCEAEIRLYFRHTAHGKLWWEEISLQEIEPIPPRLVKVAVAWGGHDMAFWDKWADIAGQQKVDIAVLTEDFPGLDPEPQDGPSFQWMAKKARRWRMHLTGSIMEQRGDLILNSSPLYDREGGLLGIYSKNQLYDLEQDKGVTAGIGMPVFKTDFGVVGITTCYDNWFPEPARLLAYKGAELICLSAAGYYAGLIPSRAGDNCLTYAVSSNSNRAGIWDSGGVRAGDQDWHDRDPSMWTLTSIQDYTVDNENYMLTAVIDLNLKYSPHIAGGNMQSAPGGRRCRQTLIEPLEEEIAREARRWWEEE